MAPNEIFYFDRPIILFVDTFLDIWNTFFGQCELPLGKLLNMKGFLIHVVLCCHANWKVEVVQHCCENQEKLSLKWPLGY